MSCAVCWKGSQSYFRTHLWCSQYLAELFEKGYQTSSLNSVRSAISSAHDHVDGVSIGKHPLICQVLKGAFNARPPLLRYTTTWDVQMVLQYLEGIGPSTSLSLKFLTFKLAMLLALTRPSRSANLAAGPQKVQSKRDGISPSSSSKPT